MTIEIITTVEDKSGDKATSSLHVQTGATIAQLNTFAPLWATAFNDMILGKIIAMMAKIDVSTATITDNLGATSSDRQHIGKFMFRTVQGTKVQVNIPCLDESTVEATSSDILDPTDEEVADFIAAMESGIAVTGGTIAPCDIGEFSVAAVVFAREGFRNSGARK